MILLTWNIVLCYNSSFDYLNIMRHILLNLYPVFSLLFRSFFPLLLSKQKEHIATRLHCPWFSVERINPYDWIICNGHESNRYLRQKFLRQKINSLQIKVCRFQWTPSFKSNNLKFFWVRQKRAFQVANFFYSKVSYYLGLKASTASG